MKSIKIKTFRSSELNTEFTNIISIEIENAPFDSGAFGEVYFCNSINGKSISAPQVLKIFIDDGTGSAERGIKTIYKLQEKIISHNIELKLKKEISIENINALRALPQFSYEGELNGKRVIGYSANLLKKGEWINFGNIFNEEDLLKRKKLRTNFYNLPVEHRMKFAHDLAEGFSHLQKMNFIYADLNPQNFFVNEREAKLCLIDFEGGAVNENPETYGKPGQWLAPEIQKQLINGPNLIKVDLNTDTWAVAIGIHYMLFPFHPLSYLTSLGNREIEEYFKKYQWPEIDKNSKLFNISNSRAYDWYINKLNSQIPKELISAFSETINKGYNNPNRRLSYKQWILAITGLMKPPKITSFIASNHDILEGNLVKLSWEVDSSTHTILINNGVGDVSSKTEIEIKPTKNSKYTLRAIGHFGAIESSIEIKVTPAPKFKELKSERGKIKNGDSTALIWEIENISEGRLVGLEKDPIIITKSGIQEIKPNQTTTYKFEVTALDGKTIVEKQ
ncbi:MAG: protein kinase, partial [Bacteroidetes bacterium]|nr:protein kinase [Bacteroidota bacterium]